jgi:Fe-S cluster assembly protein SufD
MTDARERYVAAFEARQRGRVACEPDWLRDRRGAAMERFATLGFPATREEAWRYTNVSAIAAMPFVVAGEAVEGLSRAAIDPLALAGPDARRLVFVNGRHAPALSAVAPGQDARGVTVMDLGTGLAGRGDLLERYLGRVAGDTGGGFAALGTAFLEDAAVVHLRPGADGDTPVELLFVTTAPGAALLATPRVLIVAEPGSRATVVENHVGLAEDVYLASAVSEIVLGAGASLDRVTIVRESGRAFHVGATQVVQDRDSAFRSVSITLEGALVRTTQGVLLDAPGAGCALAGLYVARGRQHVDTHTVVDHARPRGRSHQLFKGILDDRARAVFNGRVIVRRDAQQTDAHQTNKNLLLAEGAEVDTRPQLEILADDVKCTHGAAVGQLAEEAVFYLKSRGLGDDAARALLTYGFADEVLGRVPVDAVRARLEGHLRAWLRKGGRAVVEGS